VTNAALSRRRRRQRRKNNDALNKDKEEIIDNTNTHDIRKTGVADNTPEE
jgi:hypothetical protein